MKEQKQGFIQIIIIIVLLVIVLSLMGVSLGSLFSNQLLKDNFGFMGKWISNIWNNYLGAPFHYLWNIWTELIWKPFLGILHK